MSDAKVLIVDDEASIRRFLRVTLTSQGYTVFEAASGKDTLTRVAEDKPDAVILDLGLPDIDGIEVTRLLREWTQIPIIILSVRGAEKDKVAALDAGADDYLTKPFGVGELLARLRAALRRSAKAPDDPVFTSGNLKVDLSKRLVTVAGKETSLTPNEYGLLRVMVIHAGKVLTHHHLLREVWGTEYGDEFHMLHVNISNLRRKVESDPARPQLIVTEPGVGYRLKAGE
jgi:two-component system, OmpR family, KDP operon response regulator KdpE